MKNKKGFTLVEVLAVIIILALILVIAIPQILNVISSSRMSTFKISATSLLDHAEKKYYADRLEAMKKPSQITYGGINEIASGASKPCTELVELNSNDYETCTMTVSNEGVATLIEFVGKGKFAGYSCTGTKDNMTCIVDTSSTDNTNSENTETQIVFNANGGTGSMANQEFNSNELLNANTFTRDGYYFYCWNTKEDGSGIAYVDQESMDGMEGPITLYAHWENSPGFYDTTTKTFTSWDNLGMSVNDGILSAAYYSNLSRENSTGILVIPNTVTGIDSSSFSGFTGLKSVTLPNTLTSISSFAFYNTGLTSITIPNSVTTIEGGSFSNIKIRSVTIPSSVTSITYNPFEYCDKLKEIIVDPNNTKYDSRDNSNAIIETSTNTLISGSKNTVIPNTVENIKNHSFLGSSIASVVIPSNVTHVDAESFEACLDLASIVVDSNNSVYDSRNNSNAIIETSTNELIVGCKNTVIPNTVTAIGDGAFRWHETLTSITIPSSVTSIGDYAFYVTGLKSLTLPGSITNMGSAAFASSDLESVTMENGITTIGRAVFGGNKKLTSVTIPNTVTTIGRGAFDGCKGLTSITIPNSVTNIGNSAFSGSGLTSITIPSSVTSIGDSAFSECKGLTSITIPNTVTSIGNHVFNNCTGLTSVSLPSNLTSIREFMFNGCTGLTNITIPNSVTSIERQAFNGCTGLTNITIPNSVTSIKDQAFMGCTGLTSINLSNNLTSIGSSAFYGAGLTSVIIPNSVTDISSSAFYNCSHLASIDFPASVTTIGSNIFMHIANNSTIYVPSEEVKTRLQYNKYKASDTTVVIDPSRF